MGRELTATSPEPFSSSSDSVMASGTTAKAHPLNLRRAGPTQRIALDDHVLIDLLAHEAKRPRAHRMPPELAPAALGNNAEGARGKIGQQKIVRVLQMKNTVRASRASTELHRRIGRGLGRDHRARAHRIHGPHHIARGQRAAIVEAHALAQMKDQRQRIRLLPALGQRRREMKAGIARHQPIEEQLVDVLRLPSVPTRGSRLAGLLSIRKTTVRGSRAGSPRAARQRHAAARSKSSFPSQRKLGAPPSPRSCFCG
jgi:hypothetical protein